MMLLAQDKLKYGFVQQLLVYNYTGVKSRLVDHGTDSRSLTRSKATMFYDCGVSAVSGAP